LKPGDVFIDIGANSGLYTLLASEAVGNEGMVYAFEPSPIPFTRLKENVSLYGHNNIECIESALSDHEGEMKLNISGDGYSAWDTFASETRTGQTDTRKVQVTTLDKFVLDKNLIDKITMMKIDVEGWETYVLSGGLNTLSNIVAPILQIEFTDHVSMPNEVTCQKLYQQVVEFGYQVCIFDEKTGQLLPEQLRKEYPNLNLYAVKNIEEANQRLKNA
jgi:FkbM family methyltransferase